MSLRERVNDWLTSDKIKKARKKKGWPKEVVPTSRVIDMTSSRRGWGWDIFGWKYEEETDSIHLGGWCSPRPKPGDFIKVELQKSGTMNFMFVNVDYCLDPQDMWKGDVEVAPKVPV